MTTEQKNAKKTHRALVALAVIAILASACGSSEPGPTLAPATPTVATTTTVAPVDESEAAAEHPCDNGQAWREGDHCRVDGQWWAETTDGQWVKSDGPPAPTTTTTTTVAVAEPQPEPEPVTEPVADSSQEGTAPAAESEPDVDGLGLWDGLLPDEPETEQPESEPEQFLRHRAARAGAA